MALSYRAISTLANGRNSVSPGQRRLFRWHYDVLRGLDYFRAAAKLTETDPDSRLGEAINHIRSKRLETGRWPLDWSPAGRVWFEVDDGQGKPSRWVTLRAMRVLRWWDSCR